MAQFTYEYVKPIQEHYLGAPIISKDFFKWSKENMYRTSYVDTWQKKPLAPVNVHIPSYGGFVPSVKSENYFGRSYSMISRQSLNQPTLGTNPLKLSTTGFNYKRFNFIDQSKVANTHKFGAQTMLGTHPCLQPKNVISETLANFQNPSKLVPPTYRPTDVFLQNPRIITKSSGFASNCKEYDGKGWAPHKILDGQTKQFKTFLARRDITEYRIRFNSEKPVHRDTKLFHERKLKKRNVQI